MKWFYRGYSHSKPLQSGVDRVHFSLTLSCSLFSTVFLMKKKTNSVSILLELSTKPLLVCLLACSFSCLLLKCNVWITVSSLSLYLAQRICWCCCMACNDEGNDNNATKQHRWENWQKRNLLWISSKMQRNSSLHRKYKYINGSSKHGGRVMTRSNVEMGFEILFKFCENACIALRASKLVWSGNGDRKRVDNVIVMNKMSAHKLFTIMSFVSHYTSNVWKPEKIVTAPGLFDWMEKKKELQSTFILTHRNRLCIEQTHNIYILWISIFFVSFLF